MALYGVQPMLPGGPDEDLLGALASRRSGQASQLQAAQAGMGVPGQAMPGTAGPQPSQFLALMQQRRQEMESLQGQQQGLELGQKLLQALNPQLPKQARAFLLRSISQEVGVDPRGQAAKDFSQLISSLDPQSLETMRANVGQLIQQNPGQAIQLVRGAFSGQLPADQVVRTMALPQTPAGGQPGEGGAGQPATGPTSGAERPPMGLGGPVAATPLSIPTSALVQAASQAGITTAPGRPGDTRATNVPPNQPARMPFEAAGPATPATPREVQVAPIVREIAPELAGILGLDANERYRNRDVIAAGWRRIPTSYEDQQKMVETIRSLQEGVINTQVMGNQLARLIQQGGADALNLNIGRLPYLGDVQGPNPSSAMVQFGDFWNGLARSFGYEGTRVGESDEAANKIMSTSRRLAGDIITWNPELQQNANANALIQSIMINMAFAMAAAKGQSGRFLSDRDVELQLQELGRSNNPQQFLTAIRGVINRNYDQYQVRGRAMTGGEVPIELAFSPESAAAVYSGVTHPQLIQKLFGEGASPPPLNTNPTREASPSEEIRRTGGRPELSGGISDILRLLPGGGLGIAAGVAGRPPTVTQLPIDPSQAPAPAPTGVPTGEGGRPAPTLQQFQPRTIDRVPGPTVSQEEETARARAEEDRAAVLEHRAIERGRFELARSSEERAARGELRTVEEMRRRRIQDAFQAISQALSSRGAASVNIPSGSPGSDQDPSAFRIAPAQPRRAPTPIEADKFQRRR